MIVRANVTRITVRHKTEVQLVLLPDSWTQLISELSERFQIDSTFNLRAESGALVDRIELIRCDNSTVLYSSYQLLLLFKLRYVCFPIIQLHFPELKLFTNIELQ